MIFSEFVQLLHPIIGGSSSTHAFARTIFETIVNEDGLEILNEYSESSFKAYYNGTTKITKIAKAVSPYIDQTEFASYFENFSDEVMLSVCDSFTPYIPGINAINACEEMASLFAKIIKEAASTKRKSSAQESAETIEAEVVDDEEPSGAATEDKKITVIQNQVNVVQQGENNFNLTNNGTLNFNF